VLTLSHLENVQRRVYAAENLVASLIAGP
jgi:hypothetical protein